MKQLPQWAKWLIVLAALAGSALVLSYVNERATQVDMPAPDTTFGTQTTA